MRARRLGIAIVGAGLMGRWHAATARRLGAGVLGIVDADLGRANTLAAKFGARGHASLADLFTSAEPGVMHVCTPVDTHLEITRTLLERGCHVVCEKPLARDASTVAELYAHARRAGRRLCAVHQFAAQRGVDEAIAHWSKIGEPRRIAFTFNSAGGALHDAAMHDEIVHDILPHPLSVLGRLRPGHALEAIDWDVRSPSPGELVAIGAQGAALVTVSISLSARPTEASAIIAGSAGTIALDFFHGYGTSSRGQPSRADKTLRPFAQSLARLDAASRNLVRRAVAWEPAYPGLRTLLDRFYASLDGSASAAFDDSRVVDIYRARDTIVSRMAQAGRR